MLNFNADKMNQVIQTAFDKATGNRRWQVAITRAKVELENNVMLHWTGESLLIQSSTSSEVYNANGVCQCEAFKRNQPCWHRATARIYENYLANEMFDELESKETERKARQAHNSRMFSYFYE